MVRNDRVWLVSACLLGVPCRYDAQAAKDESRRRLGLLDDETIVSICPEMAGGLLAPRVPADLHGGDGADVLDGQARVIDKNGHDVTDAFLAGADAARRLVEEYGVTHACLKARSPSCGCGRVYREGALVDGDGVTAAALRRLGVVLATEEDLGL